MSEMIKLLGDKDTAANIAVKNLETAKKFYEDMLGMKEIWTQDQEIIVFKSGNSTVNVYRSQYAQYAGTNQATAMTWNVGDDVEDIVQQLKAKGVVFEHYDDMQGVTRKGDVHVAGNMKAAWFKDLDGNILGIANG
jgi:catechol 2,3-dioxygenase-like lactoylglutathione lyase family enzyme